MASGHAAPAGAAGIALLAEDSGREGSPATAATALRSPVRDTLPASPPVFFLFRFSFFYRGAVLFVAILISCEVVFWRFLVSPWS